MGKRPALLAYSVLPSFIVDKVPSNSVLTLNPATPLWQADYHSQGQKEAERFMVEVEGGGHGSLSVSLADCTASLWKAVLTDEGTFAAELSHCKMKTKFQHLSGKI